MTTVTQWFGPEARPVRKGVYQRKFDDEESYALWDGEDWHLCSDSPRVASGTNYPSFFQDLPWRGLASKPVNVPDQVPA